VLLGTAAYMSPERAWETGGPSRDIWAFGGALYEMLNGAPVFGGETTSDILAWVIRAQPEWSRLPASVPPRIRELFRRCLQKDPRQRLQAIGEAPAAPECVYDLAPDGKKFVIVTLAREQGVPAADAGRELAFTAEEATKAMALRGLPETCWGK
jgi:serine/threonine protein kinase